MGRKLDPKEAEAVMLKAGLRPLEAFKNSSSKWKCVHITCGAIVNPTYSSVARGRTGCYECGRRISENKRRTPETKAVGIMVNARLRPLEPYKNAVTKWKCECLNCGFICYPKLGDINSGQGGCKPCGYIKTGLALRIDEKEARKRIKAHKLEFVSDFNWHKKTDSFDVRCLICKKISKTNWDTLSKKNRNVGCENCSRKAAMSAQVSNEKHNELLAQHNLEPIGKYTGATDLISVKCMICGKRRKIRRINLQARKSKQQGCDKCAGARIADPIKIAKVMKKAKLEPLIAYPGGHSKWKCKCIKCGEIVYPAFNSILQGQGGCVPCGLVEAANLNRTPEAKAVLIMFNADIKPLEPYVNMNSPWKSKCLICKRIIKPTLGNVKSGHKGCIYCAPAGLGMLKNSYIYLITNKDLNAHKVGIGNVKKHMDRLGRFNARGWETHKVWQFETGREALDLEKQIFKVIRKDLKIPIYLTYEQMKSTGGHIETMGADSITLLELEKIIKKAIKGHRKNP